MNALGAGEYWGSNVNADYFPEAALINAPAGWNNMPITEQMSVSKDWMYGYPTFLQAHPFAHHRNKDSSKAFGNVELAAWNDHMKRVELVCRVDEEKCRKFDGMGIWNKLSTGQYVDVSMGCRVPFDTCSICLDWDTYRKAQATYNPLIHRSPGDAVLKIHRKLLADGKGGIRGVAITRKDYCEHMLKRPNAVLENGQKIFVYNDYPRFFDISFVFIGADRTAKTMYFFQQSTKTASAGNVYVNNFLGFSAMEEEEKIASDDFLEEALKQAFSVKGAGTKKGEIVKERVPTNLASQVAVRLSKEDGDIPKPLLERMSQVPPSVALSTAGGLGIVLRPREFTQMLSLGGHEDLDSDLNAESFSPLLARLLMPMLSSRSLLAPAAEPRATIVLVINRPSTKEQTHEKKGSTSSHSKEPLSKIAVAYNNYREQLMDFLPNIPEVLLSVGTPVTDKLASAPLEELYSHLSVEYAKRAFEGESV